jgi:hypothetical protein
MRELCIFLGSFGTIQECLRWSVPVKILCSARVIVPPGQLRRLQVPGDDGRMMQGSKDVIRKILVFHKGSKYAGLENSDDSIILSGSQGLGEAS